MWITVASPRSGETAQISVEPGEPLAGLQARLAASRGADPQRVRLVFRGAALRPGQTAAEAGLGQGSTVYCCVPGPRALALPAPEPEPERERAPALPPADLVSRLRFDEAFVRETLREAPLARRLAAADPRLAEALAAPGLPRALCALANDPTLREELARRRDRALADPSLAADLARLRDALPAAAPRVPCRYARETRALAALGLGPPRRLRRLLARCRGDVARALALLRPPE